MSILKMLGLGGEIDETTLDSSKRDTVRKIVDQLDHLEPEHARYVATFAFILSRVARADLEITDEETRSMERIVIDEGGLPEEQAMIVVQMAKTQSLLFGGTDDFSVTKEFNRISTREQRVALLNCLFGVSASDESISTVESNVIRQIADELQLDHADYAEARARYREHLAVLKQAPPETDGGD